MYAIACFVRRDVALRRLENTVQCISMEGPSRRDVACYVSQLPTDSISRRSTLRLYGILLDINGLRYVVCVFMIDGVIETPQCDVSTGGLGL